jgi:hypothetical protein
MFCIKKLLKKIFYSTLLPEAVPKGAFLFLKKKKRKETLVTILKSKKYSPSNFTYHSRVQYSKSQNPKSRRHP